MAGNRPFAAQIIRSNLIHIQSYEIHRRVMICAAPTVAVQKPVHYVLRVRILAINSDDCGQFKAALLFVLHPSNYVSTLTRLTPALPAVDALPMPDAIEAEFRQELTSHSFEPASVIQRVLFGDIFIGVMRLKCAQTL
jgi:hypothetical protein